jgi:hypothetical protein
MWQPTRRSLYRREGKHCRRSCRRFWFEGATSKSEIQKDALMAKWVRLKLTTSPLFGLTCLMSIATNVYADGRCVCTTGANTGYRPYCVPSASACEFECYPDKFLFLPTRLCNSNGIEARSGSSSEPGHQSELPGHRSRSPHNHSKQHTVHHPERGRHPAVVKRHPKPEAD